MPCFSASGLGLVGALPYFSSSEAQHLPLVSSPLNICSIYSRPLPFLSTVTVFAIHEKKDFFLKNQIGLLKTKITR
jgi:hypothetical protein